MVRKNFSIEEAERVLPILSRHLSKARDVKHEIELYENDSFDANQYLKTKIMQEEKCSLKQELCNYVQAIEESGTQLHDFNQGIIHFPVKFQGKKAVLCWHHEDGKRIKHWHYQDEACDERYKIIDVDEI